MMRRLALLVLGVSLFLLLLVVPAGAAGGVEGVAMATTVNGTKFDQRVRLDPDQPTRVELAVANNTDTPLRVRSVRLSGSVLGLTFFASSTATRLEVPARQTRAWDVDVEMEDLGAQATGLLPVQVSLVGEKGRTLAVAGATADVRGSAASTYGLFGLGLLVVTILLWVSALLATARGSLPANRWRRAVTFAPGGVGLGLVAVVTLSVSRIVAPSAPSELGFVGGAAAVSFVLGYLTPTPAYQARGPSGSSRSAGTSRPAGPSNPTTPPGIDRRSVSADGLEQVTEQPPGIDRRDVSADELEQVTEQPPGIDRRDVWADELEQVTEQRTPRHAP